ncbi:metal ABC transporter ATP-binding protein [Microbaculum marinisediminis]|uniref:Metal ABC transporter ATP-binding protein n=1 Tax=Microbaculum marinisediminis TaxID=2931392 RepID=A0AAW5R4L3_9HYPH|nr:metal ABC transporter ATP-binding protein [Microbaculum sp. A6E488]MCT8974724.1 metal ABC transporter ATP-binding protein [Microbaculum sp. A6E488]
MNQIIPEAHEKRRSAAAEAEILLGCHGLGVRRDGRWLIRDVDLEVRRGEIVSIVGPNGGGKTTLIKTLLGIERPSAGHIVRPRGVKLGYVPQRLAVDRTMPLSVERLMTLVRRAPRADVAAALEETAVAHLLRRPVQELSGGEFQRVLISRALLGKPDMLVLDEPVQSVDFSGQVDLYRLIASLRDLHGCGVLMVSHDLHVVMRATDRVLCLAGHVCCTGEPGDVSRSPEYMRLFGPQAADTLAIYAHKHDHVHTPSGEVVPAHGHDHDHHHHGHAGEGGH